RARRRPRAPLFPYTTLFRSALNAVRGCYLDDAVLRLVDLGGAHPRPQLGHLRRYLRLHADVIRRVVARLVTAQVDRRELVERELDRKSTRLNSSHVAISYAV